MTMTVDNQQRFGGINFDHMLPYTSSPQFSSPWSSSAPTLAHSSYAPAHNIHPTLSLNSDSKHHVQRLDHASLSPYARLPVAAPSTGSSLLTDVYGSQELLAAPQELLLQNRTMASGYGHDPTYAGAPSPVSHYPTSPTPYDSMGYAPAPVRSTFALQQASQDSSRRLSHPSAQPTTLLDISNDGQRVHRQNSAHDFNDRGHPSEPNRAFSEAIDASRGMLAMSQNTTPRNIYEATQGRAGRGSSDSYGFPSTHSANSSISSSSNYQSYFGGSMESSVSDYSNAGSDIESVSSRTLPRPSGFHTGGAPPAPQSMMGQFSSKVSSSTQKKHKCKVCDKRFTRPSSLQTHLYSHTGEKPFSCEVDGCGRHFSVVSNLRRHRKVHKGAAPSEAGSEDHQSDE